MQHARGRLDYVLRRLASTGKAVVFAHCEILVATCPILQLKDLTRNDRVLLRHTAEWEGIKYRRCLVRRKAAQTPSQNVNVGTHINLNEKEHMQLCKHSLSIYYFEHLFKYLNLV